MHSVKIRRLVFSLLGFAVLGVIFGVILCIPVSPGKEDKPAMSAEPLDLSGFSSDDPPRQLRLLFIHHSCGGQWLAPVGPDQHTDCIYETAVNGGGLHDRLVAAGYEVHEASYKSLVGGKTNIFHWPRKFRDHMEEVLRCDHQDKSYGDSRRNEIVIFKSCFPQNAFVGRGRAPGNPEGPELTVENAKAAYTSLLAEFAKQPDVLFVAVTAPPLALPSTALWKAVAKRVLGRPDVRVSGPYAREFNNWLKDSKTGWLSSYPAANVVVFDLYHVLTDDGASNFSRYPSGRLGRDSHPSSEGNRKAAEAFVPFLNRAVRRAGLAEDATPPDRDGRSACCPDSLGGQT